jgi:tetratricopeptide (TPR) repeat protein
MKVGRVFYWWWLLLLLVGCSNQFNQYLEQGKVALKNKEYQEAVSYFEKAVNEKNEKEAQQLLEETKTKLQVLTLMEKGKKVLADKKVDEAILIFTELIDTYEKEAEVKELVKQTETLLADAKQQMVNTLLQNSEDAVKRKEYGLAKKYLSKLLEQDQEQDKAKTLLTFCQNMLNGTQALRDGKVDEAISLFTIALNAQPNNKDAQQLKEEALNRKQESETLVTTAPNYDPNMVIGEENTAPVVDEATVQFKNAMVELLNSYQQNVINQFQAVSAGMTSPGVLMVEVEHNYRQSLNVYVPYTDYQPIMDNWLTCLEFTREYLQMIKNVGNGDYSDNSAEIIQNMTNYYGLTQNGLNSIQ